MMGPLQYKLALLTNHNQVINNHIRYIILYAVIILTVIWSYVIKWLYIAIVYL